MNSRWMIVLVAGAVACPWLAESASAQRRIASPQVRSTVNTTVASQSPVTAVLVSMADLTCVISATATNPTGPGTITVKNGDDLAYGGGAPKATINASVKNTGAGGAASPFVIAVTSNVNGSIKTTTTVVPNLNAGLWQPLPPFDIGFGSISNDIKVQVTADSGASIAEANEGNNACSIAFEADVVH